MNYFPAFFDLKQRPRLLVRGGEAAARRLRPCWKAGARVTVVARGGRGDRGPRSMPAGSRPVRRLRLRRRPTARPSCSPPRAARGRRAGGRGARTAGVPVNVADQAGFPASSCPPSSNAIRGDRHLHRRRRTRAGQAACARRRAALPSRLGRLANFADSFRTAVKGTVPSAAARLRSGTASSRAGRDQLLAGNDRGARERC